MPTRKGPPLTGELSAQLDSGFPVVGLPKPTLHRDIGAIAENCDWVLVDGPPRVTSLARSAIAASDLVLIPVQPSPFDVWASRDILDILEECSVVRPGLQARFVVNRLFARTRLGDEVRGALAALPIAALRTAIRNRTEYAKAVREGRTAMETVPESPAANDIRALAAEIRAVINESRQCLPLSGDHVPQEAPKNRAAALDAFVRAKDEGRTKRLNAEIPAALHARVKAACALEGRDMTQVVIELLEQRFPAQSQEKRLPPSRSPSSRT